MAYLIPITEIVYTAQSVTVGNISSIPKESPLRMNGMQARAPISLVSRSRPIVPMHYNLHRMNKIV